MAKQLSRINPKPHKYLSRNPIKTYPQEQKSIGQFCNFNKHLAEATPKARFLKSDLIGFIGGLIEKKPSKSGSPPFKTQCFYYSL